MTYEEARDIIDYWNKYAHLFPNGGRVKTRSVYLAELIVARHEALLAEQQRIAIPRKKTKPSKRCKL